MKVSIAFHYISGLMLAGKILCQAIDDPKFQWNVQATYYN